MKNAPSLKDFVYRTLVRRLVITALVVAGVFAALSYFHSRDMVTETVLKVATNRLVVVRGRFEEQLSRGMPLKTALRDAINYPPGGDLRLAEGRFVHVRLYDAKGQPLDTYRHEGMARHKAVEQYLEELQLQFPQGTAPAVENVEIDGWPYIQIFARMSGEDGVHPDIWVDALFAVSEEAVNATRWRMLETMAYVIGIVLLTTLLLFPVITHLTRRLADYSMALLDANLETLEVLGGAIAKRDSDTDAHNYRVTLYAVRLAEKMGLDDEQIRALIKGAFLHDVGKLAIPDAVLLKPGRLDEAEFEIMKTHVQHGRDIIRRSRWLEDADAVVGGHHEKFGGGGYPAGSSGAEIPLTARIFAIADVFDALTSRRPYKDPLPFDRTMEILKEGRGQHFDPALLDAFAAIAPALYEEYSGRDDDGLKEELRATTRRYFHGGLDTLTY